MWLSKSNLGRCHGFVRWQPGAVWGLASDTHGWPRGSHVQGFRLLDFLVRSFWRMDGHPPFQARRWRKGREGRSQIPRSIADAGLSVRCGVLSLDPWRLAFDSVVADRNTRRHEQRFFEMRFHALCARREYYPHEKHNASIDR